MLTAQGFSFPETPRSIYRVEKLFMALGKYAPGRVGDPVMSEELKSGLALARACFARPSSEAVLHILPLNPETIVKVTSKPRASAGLTAYGCSKGEAQVRALERGKQTLLRKKAPEPCLGFTRTQFDDKTRLVWAYPYSETVIEGLVAYRLIQNFKSRNTPMAFALPTCALGTKLRVAAYRRKFAYSIDMSSYDASISAKLIHWAFEILRTWYDGDEVEPTTGLTVRQVFDHVEDYFTRTPIVMPDGNLYLGKRHGVPSGSFFTQLIDSIVNVIIAGTIGARFNLCLSKSDIFVLGDDLLIWTDRDMDLDKMARFASQTFGVEFNASKSAKYRSGEKIHYLGRDWVNGVPETSDEAVLARMVYPETFRKYSTDPEERSRQVKLLFLSFASVYRNAYPIMRQAISAWSWRETPGAVEVNASYREGRELELDTGFLTGLQKYLREFVRHGSPGSSVAVQFLK
jgi:hypothetical protein